jgi:hypothetical protein
LANPILRFKRQKNRHGAPSHTPSFETKSESSDVPVRVLWNFVRSPPLPSRFFQLYLSSFIFPALGLVWGWF